MSNKYTGTITVIGETQTISDKLEKKTFVLTDSTEKYPQKVQFELLNARCGLLDKFRVGSLVDVEFNIRGREFNGKYFVNLEAWKISNVQVDSGNTTSSAGESNPIIAASSQEDDLPF